MKAIVSHDVDHITVWEHFAKDLILPKFIVRSNIELLKGKIGPGEFAYRMGDFLSNKWQCIDDLIAFNKQQNIPSCFFMGVNNGLGLSYNISAAGHWIKRIRDNGCDIGVHGVAFDSFSLIMQEMDEFRKLSGKHSPGIRMHYVRRNNDTILNLEKAGYRFDTTEHSFRNPYRIGKMWEFPFQVMDGWVIEKGGRWQTQNLEQAKESTKALINKAFEEKLDYLGVDFHDRYFSKSFRTWMEWYVWLIGYLKENKISFTNFEDAILELESREQ